MEEIKRHPNTMKILPIAAPIPKRIACLIIRVNPFQAALMKLSLVKAT